MATAVLAIVTIATAAATPAGAAPGPPADPAEPTTTVVPSTSTTAAPPPSTTTGPTTTVGGDPPRRAPRPTTTVPADGGLAPSSVPTSTADPPPPAPTVVTTPVATDPVAAPTGLDITVYPDQIGQILATIRYMESRGVYSSPPNRGNASGAYQYIPSTWDGYGGYPHAYLAPPAVQDERAARDVVRFLAEWNQDVSMIPVLWYYPAAARDPSLMDTVPRPGLGNVLTIREYQQRWLGVFATFGGEQAPALPRSELDLAAAAYAPQVDGAPPVVPERDDGQPSLSFPVLGPVRVAVPDCDDAEVVDGAPSRADIEAAGLCRPEAPGIVFGVKLQPVLAVADGVVTAVDDDPGADRPIAVTVTDAAGRSYVYAGFNDDNPGTDDGAAPDHLRLTALARIGGTVRAGQVLGFMGDTDPLPIGVRADVPTDPSVTLDPGAVAPHVRLTIFDLDGRAVDAYGPVIDALLRQSCTVTIGPWSTVPGGDSLEPVVVEAAAGPTGAPARWTITATGEVRAEGWATMVDPNDVCGNVPTEPYGAGAAGATDPPASWTQPIDLPTTVWVDLAVQQTTAAGGELVNDF